MKDTLSAWWEFARRYAEIFRGYWSVREQLDPPSRSADELAFLPAQLELVETPVSPVPRWSARLIVAVFFVALLWATFGKLDIVAVAPGKTVPGSRTKIIQPLEAAVVKAIHVTDGQHVKAGDVLIELDASGTSADAKKASEAFTSAEGSRARYAAELAALDSGEPPKPFKFPGTADEIETENGLAQSEYRAFTAKRESLGSQLAQRQAELATTREMITHLKESADLARERSSDLEALVEKKYVSRHDYLSAQQAQVDAERDLSQQQSRIHELEAAISAQRDERASLIADFRRQVSDGLRQASDQSGQLQQDADKARRRDELMQLKAPVDGTVQQLAIHTVGGVVTPAQILMAVVPDGDSLEVEAMIVNRDIGFVRPGQSVVVKVDSFPYTRYGYVDGRLMGVSHDAEQDDKLGLIYRAKIRLNRSFLVVNGVRIQFSPGMTLTAEIKTGKRRVIEYLLSPLAQYSEESLRER